MKIIDFPYIISKQVDSYDQIKTDAEELKKFVVNKKNFQGRFKKMLAVHHSQICTQPYNFFVVHSKLCLGEGDQVFADRVIINPEIIWSNPDERMHKRMLEACASFPFHSPVKVERCLHIRVKYQVLKPDGSLDTIEEDVVNLKAEIFQHETQHGHGSNIFFPDRKAKEQR